jgi:hypothetical protein
VSLTNIKKEVPIVTLQEEKDDAYNFFSTLGNARE